MNLIAQQSAVLAGCPRYRLVNLARAMSAPRAQHQWIVQKLLRSSGLSLLAGKPKSGKSTLARQLAVSVARGVPFLGRPTRVAPVLYVALEDIDDELLNSFQRETTGVLPSNIELMLPSVE